MAIKTDILLESGTNELEIMEFTIADNHFGINVAKIAEIMQYQPITHMPNSNPYVEGIFKPRDQIMTVIDLASYMNLPNKEDTERDILIITNFNKLKTAFHAHTVEGIVRISWENIEKPNSTIYGGEEGLATGIARLQDRLITIVDFEKILADINPEASIQKSDILLMGKRNRSSKPIVIAEDSPLLKKLILESLQEAGYENVHSCSNGKEAWEWLQEIKNSGDDYKKHICCLITDIEMPLMDGHRLIKLVREDHYFRGLPVMIFSSLITDEMRLKGKALGATEQITKPEIANLVTVLDRIVL